MNFEETRTEINFSAEVLFEVIDNYIDYSNINKSGEATEDIIARADKYIGEHIQNEELRLNLGDYLGEISASSSSYAYKEGFKEGIRLFRTLMKL